MAYSQSFASSIPGSLSRSPDSGGAPFQSHGTPAWIRFTWQSAGIGAAPEGADLIRPATREEGGDVLKIFLLALSMDSAWNDSLALAEQHLKAEVGRLFNGTEPLCLVIPKGNRIIAASLMDPTPEASSHLVSGPAVLMEYRNRGIGSRLLHASLNTLREAGLETASGVTRGRSVASRHVYPKFGGIGAPVIFPKAKEEKSKA